VVSVAQEPQQGRTVFLNLRWAPLLGIQTTSCPVLALQPVVQNSELGSLTSQNIDSLATVYKS
jgi:hypothetical protein